jgi:hypothetical protein
MPDDDLAPDVTTPWENPDGTTNVAEFLNAYADDDNVFWATPTGHLQNVLDDLIERVVFQERMLIDAFNGYDEAADRITLLLGQMRYERETRRGYDD